MGVRWKKLSDTELRINRFRSLRNKKFRLPNGTVGNFYTFVGGRIVCALVMTKKKEVVLINQFSAGLETVLHELPGGKVDKNETPFQAAKREVREETGYTGKFIFLGTSNNNRWSSSMRWHYLVVDAVRVGKPKPDKYESLKVEVVPLTQLKKYLERGCMSDTETAYRALERAGVIRWTEK